MEIVIIMTNLLAYDFLLYLVFYLFLYIIL